MNALTFLPWERALPTIETMAKELLRDKIEPPAHLFFPGEGHVRAIVLGSIHKESWESLVAKTLQRPGAPDWFGALLPSTSRVSAYGPKMELMVIACMHRDGRRSSSAIPYVSRRGRILVRGGPDRTQEMDCTALFGNPWLTPPPPDRRATSEGAVLPGLHGHLLSEFLAGAKRARLLPGAFMLSGSPPAARLLTRVRRSAWPQEVGRATRNGAKEFLIAFGSDAYITSTGGPAFAVDEPGEKFFGCVWRGAEGNSAHALMPYQWQDGVVESDFELRRPTREMQAYLDRIVPDPWSDP